MFFFSLLLTTINFNEKCFNESICYSVDKRLKSFFGIWFSNFDWENLTVALFAVSSFMNGWIVFKQKCKSHLFLNKWTIEVSIQSLSILCFRYFLLQDNISRATCKDSIAFYQLLYSYIEVAYSKSYVVFYCLICLALFLACLRLAVTCCLCNLPDSFDFFFPNFENMKRNADTFTRL